MPFDNYYDEWYSSTLPQQSVSGISAADRPVRNMRGVWEWRAMRDDMPAVPTPSALGSTDRVNTLPAAKRPKLGPITDSGSAVAAVTQLASGKLRIGQGPAPSSAEMRGHVVTTYFEQQMNAMMIPQLEEMIVAAMEKRARNIPASPNDIPAYLNEPVETNVKSPRIPGYVSPNAPMYDGDASFEFPPEYTPPSEEEIKELGKRILGNQQPGGGYFDEKQEVSEVRRMGDAVLSDVEPVARFFISNGVHADDRVLKEALRKMREVAQQESAKKANALDKAMVQLLKRMKEKDDAIARIQKRLDEQSAMRVANPGGIQAEPLRVSLPNPIAISDPPLPDVQQRIRLNPVHIGDDGMDVDEKDPDAKSLRSVRVVSVKRSVDRKAIEQALQVMPPAEFEKLRKEVGEIRDVMNQLGQAVTANSSQVFAMTQALNALSQIMQNSFAKQISADLISAIGDGFRQVGEKMNSPELMQLSADAANLSAKIGVIEQRLYEKENEDRKDPGGNAGMVITGPSAEDIAAALFAKGVAKTTDILPQIARMAEDFMTAAHSWFEDLESSQLLSDDDVAKVQMLANSMQSIAAVVGNKDELLNQVIEYGQSYMRETGRRLHDRQADILNMEKTIQEKQNMLSEINTQLVALKAQLVGAENMDSVNKSMQAINVSLQKIKEKGDVASTALTSLSANIAMIEIPEIDVSNAQSVLDTMEKIGSLQLDTLKSLEASKAVAYEMAQKFVMASSSVTDLQSRLATLNNYPKEFLNKLEAQWTIAAQSFDKQLTQLIANSSSKMQFNELLNTAKQVLSSAPSKVDKILEALQSHPQYDAQKAKQELLTMIPQSIQSAMQAELKQLQIRTSNKEYSNLTEKLAVFMTEVTALNRLSKQAIEQNKDDFIKVTIENQQKIAKLEAELKLEIASKTKMADNLLVNEQDAKLYRQQAAQAQEKLNQMMIANAQVNTNLAQMSNRVVIGTSQLVLAEAAIVHADEILIRAFDSFPEWVRNRVIEKSGGDPSRIKNFVRKFAEFRMQYEMHLRDASKEVEEKSDAAAANFKLSIEGVNQEVVISNSARAAEMRKLQQDYLTYRKEVEQVNAVIRRDIDSVMREYTANQLQSMKLADLARQEQLTRESRAAQAKQQEQFSSVQNFASPAPLQMPFNMPNDAHVPTPSIASGISGSVVSGSALSGVALQSLVSGDSMYATYQQQNFAPNHQTVFLGGSIASGVDEKQSSVIAQGFASVASGTSVSRKLEQMQKRNVSEAELIMISSASGLNVAAAAAQPLFDDEMLAHFRNLELADFLTKARGAMFDLPDMDTGSEDYIAAIAARAVDILVTPNEYIRVNNPYYNQPIELPIEDIQTVSAKRIPFAILAAERGLLPFKDQATLADQIIFDPYFQQLCNEHIYFFDPFYPNSVVSQREGIQTFVNKMSRFLQNNQAVSPDAWNSFQGFMERALGESLDSRMQYLVQNHSLAKQVSDAVTKLNNINAPKIAPSMIQQVSASYRNLNERLRQIQLMKSTASLFNAEEAAKSLVLFRDQFSKVLYAIDQSSSNEGLEKQNLVSMIESEGLKLKALAKMIGGLFQAPSFTQSETTKKKMGQLKDYIDTRRAEFENVRQYTKAAYASTNAEESRANLKYAAKTIDDFIVGVKNGVVSKEEDAAVVLDGLFTDAMRLRKDISNFELYVDDLENNSVASGPLSLAFQSRVADANKIGVVPQAKNGYYVFDDQSTLTGVKPRPYLF